MSTSEQQEATQEQPEGGAQDDIIDIAENVETFQETEQKASNEDIQQNAAAAAQNQWAWILFCLRHHQNY